MATHSNILAQRIPWTEEPGRLQSTGSQRIGHDLYADDTTLMAENEEELKRKVKEESAKADLKLNIQKTRIRPMVLSLHGKQREKKWKQ